VVRVALGKQPLPDGVPSEPGSVSTGGFRPERVRSCKRILHREARQAVPPAPLLHARDLSWWRGRRRLRSAIPSQLLRSREEISCAFQTQPLAPARGSACAFDRAGPRGHPVRERLRTFETLGQLIVSWALSKRFLLFSSRLHRPARCRQAQRTAVAVAATGHRSHAVAGTTLPVELLQYGLFPGCRHAAQVHTRQFGVEGLGRLRAAVPPDGGTEHRTACPDDHHQREDQPAHLPSIIGCAGEGRYEILATGKPAPASGRVPAASGPHAAF